MKPLARLLALLAFPALLSAPEPPPVAVSLLRRITVDTAETVELSPG